MFANSLQCGSCSNSVDTPLIARLAALLLFERLKSKLKIKKFVNLTSSNFCYLLDDVVDMKLELFKFCNENFENLLHTFFAHWIMYAKFCDT